MISLGNTWWVIWIIFKRLWLRVQILSFTQDVMLGNPTPLEFQSVCLKSARYQFLRIFTRIHKLLCVYVAYTKKSMKFKNIVQINVVYFNSTTHNLMLILSFFYQKFQSSGLIESFQTELTFLKISNIYETSYG